MKDSNSTPKLDQWFEAARQEPLKVSQTQAQELIENLLEPGMTTRTSQSIFRRFSSLKSLFIMLSIISAIGIALWLFLPSQPTASPTNPQLNTLIIPPDTIALAIDSLSILESTDPIESASASRLIPASFPQVLLDYATLADLGFTFGDDRILYSTYLDKGDVFYFEHFQENASTGSSWGTTSNKNEPQHALMNGKKRTYDLSKTQNRGFFAMYATDLNARQIFTQELTDINQHYKAYVPVLVPTPIKNLRPSLWNPIEYDTLVFYFTPTPAFFAALPTKLGQTLAEINQQVEVDPHKNLYFFRPMHIEHYLKPSQVELERLGLEFAPDGCWSYKQNIEGKGELRLLGVGVGVGPIINSKPARTYYPMFISDLEGNQPLKYSFRNEPIHKSNEAYLRLHQEDLVPVLIPENACQDELLLWFNDVPAFWEALASQVAETRPLEAEIPADSIEKYKAQALQRLAQQIPLTKPINLAKLTVSPNPAHETIEVAVGLRKTDQISLNLLDLQGRIVQVLLPLQAQNQSNQTYRFPLLELPAGVYVLLLDSQAGGRLTKRIRIE